MKEAFWGVLIVMLGMIGVVIIQLFQNITITNDQTYYLLKETTEASMLDSIDLSYYRTKGKIKITEEKFVENLARRFAESANINGHYDIKIHDIIEEPPKISLSIGAYAFSLEGEKFKIGQSISAVIETKYQGEGTPPCNLGDSGCVTPPPIPPGDCPVCVEGDPNCNAPAQCIDGDLRFVGWGDVTISPVDCPSDFLTNVDRQANYQSCACGKWTYAADTIESDIAQTSTDYKYSWHFIKSTPIRTLDLISTKQGSFGSCVPPTGVSCEDTYVAVNKSTTITPTYIPSNTTERTLTWSVTKNPGLISLQYPSGKIGLTGTSIATVTGKKVGTSQVTAKDVSGHTGTCNVYVTSSGNGGDSLTCTKVSMDTEDTAYGSASPKVPGTKYQFTDSSDTNIASINKTTGLITSKTKVTTIYYTVSAPGYNTSPKCSIKISKPPIPPDDDTPTGCMPGSISIRWDTGNKWPNRKGPKLCPQDFENIQRCAPPYPGGPSVCNYYMDAQTLLGMSNDKVSYCGYNGGYTYPHLYHYDKTETKNSSLITNGGKSLNESNHTYSVTFTHTFTYEGWNTAVGPYTRGVSTVSKNYTITGSLYKREDASCGESASAAVALIISCPSGGLIDGSSATQISVDRYGTSALKDSTATWTISGTSYLAFSGASSGTAVATSVKVKGVRVGTAILKYKVQKTDGTWVSSSNSCSIPIYPKCSDVYISGPSSINKYVNDDYSIYPSFGGESAWSTSNSSVLDIGDTSTFRSFVTATGKKAGTAKITATRRIDGCSNSNMKKTVTVKQTYKCPTTNDGYKTKEYPLNDDYCYTEYKVASFNCSSTGTYRYSGWSRAYNKIMCFTSSYDASTGYGACIEPSVCNPWHTGYYQNHCYYLYRKEPN